MDNWTAFWIFSSIVAIMTGIRYSVKSMYEASADHEHDITDEDVEYIAGRMRELGLFEKKEA